MIDDRLVGYVNGWVAGWLGWLSYWHVWFCSVDLLAILIVWSLVCLSVYVFVLFDFCYFFVRSVFGCCLVCVFRLLLIRLLACSLDRPLLVVLLLLRLRLPPPLSSPPNKNARTQNHNSIDSVACGLFIGLRTTSTPATPWRKKSCGRRPAAPTKQRRRLQVPQHSSTSGNALGRTRRLRCSLSSTHPISVSRRRWVGGGWVCKWGVWMGGCVSVCYYSSSDL